MIDEAQPHSRAQDYWILLHVNPHSEFAARDFLERRCLAECYLPTGVSTTKPKRKRRAVEIVYPAFPGWLFVLVDHEAPIWGVLERCPGNPQVMKELYGDEYRTYHVPARFVVETWNNQWGAGLYDSRSGRRQVIFQEGSAARIEQGAAEGLAGIIRRVTRGGKVTLDVGGRCVITHIDKLAASGL